LIELSDVSKYYGTKLAVDNLSLEVRKGEIFGFIGPNGAGKTTTIKMMVGILRPDGGRIFVDNIDAVEHPIYAKRILGYVPDTPILYESLTGLQFINFIADAYNVSSDERMRNINYYSELFEIKEALRELISSYSHGMKQKLVILSALVHNPSVLVLDEPLVGLDPKAAFNLKNIMKEHVKKGNTVFFSTHILEVAEKLCDRVGIIKNGKLIACGTLDELKEGKDETLENIFMELVE